MNILHTSDWHLGKRLMDRERLPEQIAALDELAEICEREKIELVLVAGDVFDTFLPSSEAEEVFYRTVKKLAGETRAVIIVSGNHDDGVRLSASAPLAEEQGIYIFGNKPKIFICGGTRPVRAVASGEGYLIMENAAGERVYVNALPYPNEARFREEKTEESFSEKISRWVARGEAEYRGDIPHILLTHLFVAGGKTSESERNIDLGGARAVPLYCLPESGYIALGHLHRRQKVGVNAYYSGSILQYSFDETNTEKSVFVFRTSEKEIVDIRQIPLTAGKKLVRLECGGTDAALALLPEYSDCFIELTLHLAAPLTASETQALREANEGLVSLVAKVSSLSSAPVACRSALSPQELFAEYFRSVYGEIPSNELNEAFLALLEEV